MAEFVFQDLMTVYENFEQPFIILTVDGKDIVKAGFKIIASEISMTSGFESSIATFDIADVYDKTESSFEIDKIKKVFLLGKTVEASIGYATFATTVYKGFIAQVSFKYREMDLPIMQITCMDIKGVMMGGTYHRQLQAKDYSGAVKEIFEKTSLKTLTDNSIYKLKVTDTPDHKQEKGSPEEEEANPFTVEMVNETDYEFVVRAAKKFNYEFFCNGGTVYFRKAREDRKVLMEIGPDNIITDYNIEYNIIGLAKNLEVRGVNPDKGEVIIAKRKLNNKISLGAKADPLIKDTSFILQDATVNSDADGNARLDYLENEISRRFAKLDIEMIGLPEYQPGRFIELERLTSGVSKKFYITKVTHRFETGYGYKSRLEGYAPTISDW